LNPELLKKGAQDLVSGAVLEDERIHPASMAYGGSLSRGMKPALVRLARQYLRLPRLLVKPPKKRLQITKDRLKILRERLIAPNPSRRGRYSTTKRGVPESRITARVQARDDGKQPSCATGR
jgi:hypothetical protein